MHCPDEQVFANKCHLAMHAVYAFSSQHAYRKWKQNKLQVTSIKKEIIQPHTSANHSAQAFPQLDIKAEITCGYSQSFCVCVLRWFTRTDTQAGSVSFEVSDIVTIYVTQLAHRTRAPTLQPTWLSNYVPNPSAK